MTTAAKLAAMWFTMTCSVERRSGDGAVGPVFAAATDVVCFVDPSTKQIRSSTGETVLSFAAVFAAADVAAVPIGSRVTLPADVGGAVGYVLSSAVHTSGVGTPDHLELRLG